VAQSREDAMTADPRGVYQSEGDGQEPNTVLLETGTVGLVIPEKEYRDGRYQPDFDALPWSHEYDAANKKDENAHLP
jgi:hypothetical protein